MLFVTTGTHAAPQAPAQTDPLLAQKIEQLSQTLQATTKVSGQFNQLRTVKGLSKPLASSGQFVYWKDQGVYWQTDSPHPQAITYTNDRTILWQAPGIPSGKKNKTQRDKHFRKILLSLFSFDQQQLHRQFITQWQINEPQWLLTLSPKNSITRRGLNRVTLSGAKHIQHIEIINSKGEKLSISFSNIQPLDKITVDRCIKQFGLDADRCNQLIATP